MPMFSPAGQALGFGGMRSGSDPLAGETDEERRKKLLLQQQQRLLPNMSTGVASPNFSPAGASLFGGYA